MAEFSFTELLPLGHDDTAYRKIGDGGVHRRRGLGSELPAGRAGGADPPHRAGVPRHRPPAAPGHLRSCASILDDPEASPNDRFVALELLKNANIAAGGILPMCQDTGTAIVMGKKGQRVLTGGDDEEHIARGIYDTYTDATTCATRRWRR